MSRDYDYLEKATTPSPLGEMPDSYRNVNKSEVSINWASVRLLYDRAASVVEGNGAPAWSVDDFDQSVEELLSVMPSELRTMLLEKIGADEAP